LLGKLNTAKAIEEALHRQRKPVGTVSVMCPPSLLSLQPFIGSCARCAAAVIRIIRYQLDFCEIPIKTLFLLFAWLKDFSAICDVFFYSHLLNADIQMKVKQLDIRAKQLILLGDQYKHQQSHMSPSKGAKAYIKYVFFHHALLL
jgi:hypothetical protein